jgi:hypothetical protein
MRPGNNRHRARSVDLGRGPNQGDGTTGPPRQRRRVGRSGPEVVAAPAHGPGSRPAARVHFSIPVPSNSAPGSQALVRVPWAMGKAVATIPPGATPGQKTRVSIPARNLPLQRVLAPAPEPAPPGMHGWEQYVVSDPLHHLATCSLSADDAERWQVGWKLYLPGRVWGYYAHDHNTRVWAQEHWDDKFLVQVTAFSREGWCTKFVVQHKREDPFAISFDHLWPHLLDPHRQIILKMGGSAPAGAATGVLGAGGAAAAAEQRQPPRHFAHPQDVGSGERGVSIFDAVHFD